MVQRPVIVSIHTGPKSLVFWFAIEPSNKQHKGSGIKDISKGVDAVPNDSVSCRGLGGQGSLPGVRNLPGGKSPGARLTTLCNILPQGASHYSRQFFAALWCHAEDFSVVLGLRAPQTSQLASGRANSALLTESQIHVTMHTDVVCYYCPIQ